MKKKRQVIKHEMPPISTRLRGRTRGKDVYAGIVSVGDKIGILFNNNVYTSMSAAARAATGNSTDGWLFWKVIEGK